MALGRALVQPVTACPTFVGRRYQRRVLFLGPGKKKQRGPLVSAYSYLASETRHLRPTVSRLQSFAHLRIVVCMYSTRKKKEAKRKATCPSRPKYSGDAGTQRRSVIQGGSPRLHTASKGRPVAGPSLHRPLAPGLWRAVAVRLHDASRPCNNQGAENCNNGMVRCRRADKKTRNSSRSPAAPSNGPIGGIRGQTSAPCQGEKENNHVLPLHIHTYYPCASIRCTCHATRGPATCLTGRGPCEAHDIISMPACPPCLAPPRWCQCGKEPFSRENKKARH